MGLEKREGFEKVGEGHREKRGGLEKVCGGMEKKCRLAYFAPTRKCAGSSLSAAIRVGTRAESSSTRGDLAEERLAAGILGAGGRVAGRVWCGMAGLVGAGQVGACRAGWGQGGGGLGGRRVVLTVIQPKKVFVWLRAPKQSRIGNLEKSCSG